MERRGPRPRGWPDLFGSRRRGAGNDVRRSRLQHGYVGLSGDADRPVLSRTDRRHDGRAHRELRTQRRGRRVVADPGGGLLRAAFPGPVLERAGQGADRTGALGGGRRGNRRVGRARPRAASQEPGRHARRDLDRDFVRGRRLGARRKSEGAAHDGGRGPRAHGLEPRCATTSRFLRASREKGEWRRSTTASRGTS